MKKIVVFIICFLFINNSFVIAENLDCGSVLKRGSSGSNVSVLQRKLNTYMKCGLEVDGIFGRKTYACVVKFQDKYNLESDGIVGPKTCRKLNSNTDIVNDDMIDVSNKNNIVVTSSKASIKYGVSSRASTIKNVVMGDVLIYTTTVKIDGVKWYRVKVNDRYGYIKASSVSNNTILVDISLQKLVYIKNGELILSTEVVTGMKDNHDTPLGKYTLKVGNKQKARTLRGYNDDGSKYAAYVDYWMPFIMSRGIGFHDAGWRSNKEFNDSTYIYDGSHGCINMKKVDAKILYTNIKNNTDVVIRK